MKAHPTHLYILLFNERKLDLLESALQQTRARLEAEGEMDLWHYWDGMRLAAQGQFEAASARATALSTENKEALEKAIAVERARQTNDWSSLADHFEKLWAEKKDTATLLALCEAKLNAGDPRFVVDHAELMIKAVGTPEALRVAATAASRISNWQFCLQLLDTHLALFPRAQLPADLRRLRIACEQNLGMLSDAERDAEALVSDEKNLENLTLLFHLRVRAGRLPEAVKSAQSILENPETPAETLLQIGWLIRLEDRQLSRVALERAVSQEINDPQQVSAATMLAHELDQHKVLAALVPKMAQLAEAPNSTIQTLDFKSTVELLRERAKQTHDTLRLFSAGGMPVHLAAEILRTPLTIWPVLALGNRTRYAPRAVFFRHGGKPGDDVPQRKFDRIYVDITAFINAHELGLLPLVEQVCPHLVLPRSVRMSLVQELDLLSRTQSADAARGKLLSLVDAGQIDSWPSENALADASDWKDGLPSEWCKALEEAVRRGGLLIDYWPKLRNDGTTWVPPADLLPRISHLGAVLTGLQNEGLVTSDQVHDAMERFPPVSTGAPTNVPTKQQVVILSGSVAKLIAQAHLIEKVAQAFQVLIPSDEIASLRQEEANYQDRSFVAGRVRVMLGRITASSLYRELLLKEPVTPLDSPNEDAAPYVLAEILQAEGGKDRWVWSDDRWLNGHEHVANLPVISTAEVLSELRKRQLLSDTEYFRLRLRMRSADFRYLPLATDELVHFLTQATTEKDGMLVETPDLVTLRRYWARALVDQNTLQFPPVLKGVPNPQGETEFFSGGIRVLHDTFSALFKNLAADDTLGIARATWLLYWIWSPVEHLGAILGKQIDSAAFQNLRGLGEGLFFARLLDANAFGTAAAVQRYGDWLQHHLYADTSRVADVRRNVERTLQQAASKVQKGTLEDQAHRAVLSRWYFNMPQWIRDDMGLSAKTRQRLGIGSQSVVGVGNQQFAPEKFWQAAEDAYKGKSAKVVALETNEAFGIRLEKNGRSPVLTLDRKAAIGEKWGFADEALGLLDGRVSRRLSLLLDHPEWFDADPTTVRREAKKIAALHTMQERITALDRVRGKSVWSRYQTIAEKCEDRRGPTIEEMSVKDVAEYAGYLRCEASTAQSIDWEKSARLLLDSVGFSEAFLRLAKIPAPLPRVLLVAYDGLPAAKKQSFVDTTAKELISPLAKAQLFRLQLRHSENDIVSVGDELLADGQLAETHALLKVVRWSWSHLGTQANLMSPLMRLTFAWVHAGQIFELLRRISEASDVARFFHKLDSHVHAEVLVQALGEDDVAYPRHVNSKVLLMSAVGAALAAEPTANFKVSEKMRKRAEALSKMEGDNVDLPQLEWLYDPAAFTNLFGSFLGAGREEQLRPFVSERVATFVSSGELARQVEALVSAVESDPSHGNSWVMLGSVMRGRSCPEPLKVRLGVVMRNTKFEALPDTETFRCATILTLATQAAEIGGDELIQIWRTKIADMAAWLGGMTGSPEEQGRRREMVIRCALALSRHGSIADPVRCFCDTNLAAWRAWPDLEPALIGMLRLLIGLPHHQLASAWNLVFALRKDARQQNGQLAVLPESTDNID